jgi:hypothetical protein
VSPLNSDIFLLSNCLQQTSPPTRPTLLTPEDLQRIEYIQFLYQQRIELGKNSFRNSFIYIFEEK